MFKIAKLRNIENEDISINYVTQRHCDYEMGKKTKDETFKTLSFVISGNNYSFHFDLNCKIEKLLEIPMNETIDFKKYSTEAYLYVEDLNSAEINIKMDIKITRYLKNRFIIFLTFYNDYYGSDEDNYSGMAEFSFDLDNYLEDKNK